MDHVALAREVDRNYDYFQRHMSKFLPMELGRYALLRHGKIVGFFADATEAEARGEQFADRFYSIQLVDPSPVNLGCYSSG